VTANVIDVVDMSFMCTLLIVSVTHGTACNVLCECVLCVNLHVARYRSLCWTAHKEDFTCTVDLCPLHGSSPPLQHFEPARVKPN